MSNVVYFSKSECDAIVANFNGRYVIAQMYYFEWSNSFSLPSSVALCPSAISVAAAGPAPAATAVPAVAFATTVTAAGAATVARSSAIAARPMRS